MISRSRINIDKINNQPDDFTMDNVVTEERHTRVVSKLPSESYKQDDSQPNFNPFNNDEAILLENNDETLNPNGGLSKKATSREIERVNNH